MGCAFSRPNVTEGQAARVAITAAYAPADAGNGVSQDMTRPLTEYFISSGHNSYLTGNQLTATSGTKTISKCLNAGCRVIELDVYNKQPGFSGPVCKHGGTLTSPVSFQECVEAIMANAFRASEFPVIITLENHATGANQEQMAHILRDCLGAALFTPSPAQQQMQEPWLSPAALKGKVLIRGNANKSEPALRELIYINNVKMGSIAEGNTKDVFASCSYGESKIDKLHATVHRANAQDDAPLLAGGDSRHSHGKASKRSLHGISGDLSVAKGSGKANASQQGSKKTTGADGHDAGSSSDEAENDASLHGTTTLQDVYRFACRHLLRVYPAGFRVNSSNYDPMKAWTVGASLAALNWQSWDEALWTNEAQFSKNGGCGYVLKPAWMRNNLRIMSSRHGTAHTSQLSVVLHSAYADQAGHVGIFKDDLYVRLEVKGMPDDCCRQQTKTVNNTDTLVVEQKFTFPIRHPDMAVLLLVLVDDDLPGSSGDDVLGYASLPLATLAPGSYHMLLKDTKNHIRQDRWIKVSLDMTKPIMTATLPLPAPKSAAPDSSTVPAHPVALTAAASPGSVANPLSSLPPVSPSSTSPGDTGSETGVRQGVRVRRRMNTGE